MGLMMFHPSTICCPHKPTKDLVEGVNEKGCESIKSDWVAIIEIVFRKIIPTNYSKQAWDIPETNFKEIDKVKVVKLYMIRREFENLKMKDNESIADFSLWICTLTN